MMDEDLSKIIKERRSVRAFLEDEIPSEIMDQVLESAIWAPSSCNRQPWHFVIVKKPEVKKGISMALASKGARKILLSAPAVIVVCIDMSRYWGLKGNLAPFLDAGVAIQNILLSAHSKGLGTCTIAGHIDEEIVKRELNLSQEFRVMGFIPIGYPKKVPPPPKRQEISSYYSIDSYDSIKGSGKFNDVCQRRAKVSRSGGDVSGNYEIPKERIPLFECAKEFISKDINENEEVLYTFSGLGFFLRFAPENVECLVFSPDEEWYIREVLGLENPLIQMKSYRDFGEFAKKYDRIVSLFDIHFMDEKEITEFIKNLNGILNDNGIIVIVFLNQDSFYGMNYRLANKFSINLESVRPCGFEHPLKIKAIKELIPKELIIESTKTRLFVPSPNLGYMLDKTPQIPYRTSRLQGLLRNMPYFKGKGSVAFLTLKNAI